jgi:DNA-binding LacI/PurR family transcriptional regulator
MNQAVTCIKTASKLGLNVPKDLAVIAFTDGIISKYSTLRLQLLAKAAKWEIELLEY